MQPRRLALLKPIEDYPTLAEALAAAEKVAEPATEKKSPA